MKQADHKFTLIIFSTLILIGFIVRIMIGDEFLYGTYFDRDLYRSFLIPKKHFLYGPELSILGNTPGGAFYYYLWIFKDLFNKNIVTTFTFLNILNYLFSLYFIIKTIKIFSNQRIVYMLGILVFSTFQVFLESSLTLWNPSLALPFHFIITYHLCSFFYQKESKRVSLYFSFILISLTAQFHLSGLFHLISFVSLSLISLNRKKLRLIDLLGCLTAFTIPYLPLLISIIVNHSSPFKEALVLSSKESNPISTLYILKTNLLNIFGSLAFHPLGFRELPTWILSKGIAKYIPPMLANVITAFFLIFTFLMGILSIKNKLHKNFYLKEFISVILVMFTFYSCLQFYFGDYSINIRKLYPFTPYIILLTCLSFSYFLSLNINRPIYSTVVVCIVTTCLLNLINFKLRTIPEFHTFQSFHQVVHFLHQKIGLSTEQIRTKVTLVRFDNISNGCVPISTEEESDFGGVENILKSIPATPNKRIGAKCYILLSKKDFGKECNLEVLKKIPQLKDLKSAGEDSYLKAFSFTHENPCPTTLNNPYLVENISHSK